MKNKKEFMRLLKIRNVFNNLFLTALAETEPKVEPEKVEEPKDKITPIKEENKPEDKKEPEKGNAFNELIEKAREEEKSKLYPTIEKLKKDKVNLNSIISERDRKIKELEEENSQLKADNLILEEGTVTNQTVQNLTSDYEKLKNDYQILQDKYDSDIAQIKLDGYKEKKIASANGAIIPELVTGNTEEEIDAAFELAKQRYIDIQQEAVSKVQMPYANPVATNQNVFANKSVAEMQSMTPAEWAEYRKTLGLK